MPEPIISFYIDRDEITCYIDGRPTAYVLTGMTARSLTRKALDFTWLLAYEENLLAYDFETDRIYCKETV